MPNKIGPYILGRTLGIGTFSKVKIAIHEPTGKRVAVKILNKQKLQQMEMEHKKDREIEILRMLNHPHVIRLYEVLDTPTDIFVVTEFVSNGELFDYIVTHGRLPEKDARRFFQQIIAGVTYCHAKGVVHRDLKPENLLLDEHNNLRIADFGLSNQVRDGFFLKTSCGSPNYAAPEVISGDLYAGPEVDVWSCGVILYALLCGTLPFDDENIPNLFRKIKSGQYRIPAYLPRGAAELIEGMLQVNPMERISVDEIRVHPWFKRNLPAYLDADPAAFIAREKRIDPKVMSAVVRKLPCPESEVREALAFGPRLLTQRRYRMGNYRRLREIAMAYHLLFDQQSKAQIASDINDVLPMVNGSTSKRLINMNSLDVSSPEQQIELHRRDQDRNFRLLTRTFEENKQFLVQWLVGLWTSLNPGQMMEHVLASLIHLQMEWHIQTPYRVIARSKLSRAERANLEEKLARKRRRRHSKDLYDDLSDPIMKRRGSTEAKTDDEDGSISYQSTIDVDSMDDDEWNEWNSFEIKIQLQLYSTRPLTGSELNRVSTPTKPRGEPRVSVVNSGFYGSRYLLDIQKLSGDTFPFLDLCAGLMQQIKYLPPR